eukprot:scaffold8739_cov77-Cyclotella_meneghiniana.AAC.1
MREVSAASSEGARQWPNFVSLWSEYFWWHEASKLTRASSFHTKVKFPILGVRVRVVENSTNELTVWQGMRPASRPLELCHAPRSNYE